jgi:hypothetical protein
MLHRTLRIAALLGTTALLASACTSLLGDFSIGTGTTGGGGSGGSTSTSTTATGTTSTTGTGGTGGTSTSTTGTGGTGGGSGGSTSTTGTGGSVMCQGAMDCTALETACLAPDCKPDGTCGTTPKPAGAVVGGQVAGDCQEIDCDGEGNLVAILTPKDYEDDQNPCTSDSCTGMMNVHSPMPPGAACVLPGDPSAKYCSPGAKCVECVSNFDCASMVCQADKCVLAGCSDGVKNGNETAVDCGGGCVGCAAGQACAVQADCLSNHCDINAHQCVAASCVDGIKNQGETAIDCGGTLCPGCQTGQTCFIGSDCQSGLCAGNVCLESLCTDGLQDGNESDVDCGGGTCDGCESGKSCITPFDCMSKVCKPGFKCE